MWPFSKIKELEKDVRELQCALLKMEKAMSIPSRCRGSFICSAAALGGLSTDLLHAKEVVDRFDEIYDYLGVQRVTRNPKTELVKRAAKK